ncbi:Uncharacterised protein [Chlamydia trachomatis]|nr:Uncharacterised protein [Chlamydia trachomatis]
MKLNLIEKLNRVFVIYIEVIYHIDEYIMS